MTGEAGADRRGLWIDDKDTGTRVRLGEVSMEMAMTLAEQGNLSAAKQAISKPRIGFFWQRRF
jgi:hypothetical protein